MPLKVTLYGSLYNDIIEDEVKGEVESLHADSYVDIKSASVAKTSECDCGIFPIAFANCLVLSKP